MFRHGDVQLIPVDKLPDDARKIENRKELAFGEVTGHAHRIDAGEIFQTKSGQLYLKVDKLAKLSHEEHNTKVIERGVYAIPVKRQYIEGRWENVKD